MATNRLKYLLLAFIFLAICAQLSAQTAAQLPALEEPRLTQRFSWSGGEYAFRYEVIFEQLVNNNYVAHSNQFITQRFIEVSLTIGDYRFRIIPYDILNRPAAASEWKYFKIIPAPRFEPGYEHPAQSEPQAQRELEFIPHYEEEIESQPEPAPAPVPAPVLAAETQEQPKEIETKDDAEELEMEPEKKNPYTLNPVLFSAGMFASLHYSLYGKEFKEDISPFNFGARLNVIFKLPMDIYIGPELTANFYQFIVMDEYNMYFLAPGFNLLALKWLPNERLAVGARFGIMYLHYTYEAFNSDNLMPSAGAIIRFRVSPVFLLEAGFDYFHIVNIAPGGYIRPWIGIGVQF